MEASHALAHARERGGHLAREIGAREEAGPVDLARLAHVRGVHVDELDRVDAQAAALEHVLLHRAVVQVLRLHPGAGLHLAQAEAAAGKALEHVRPDPHAVVLEGGLEDRGDGRIREQRTRPLDGLAVLPGLLRDQHAARKQRVRAAADLVAQVEDRLLRRVGRGGRAPARGS